MWRVSDRPAGFDDEIDEIGPCQHKRHRHDCLALAFACNLGMQLGGALALPGSVRERLTVGLVVGNRNVGLVWSELGAAATPRMALYFAATQLPIYIMPRLLEALLARSRKDCPVTGVSGRAVTIEGNADDTI